MIDFRIILGDRWLTQNELEEILVEYEQCLAEIERLDKEIEELKEKLKNNSGIED